MPAEARDHVVFFDGVCNLCNGAVQFIIARDPEARFSFAPLQSSAAVELLRPLGVVVRQEAPDSVILLEGGKVYVRSEAALRIARGLAGAWPLLAAFLVVPRFVRDAVYAFIARHRYAWFGRSDSCSVPTPALRARFLT